MDDCHWAWATEQRGLVNIDRPHCTNRGKPRVEGISGNGGTRRFRDKWPVLMVRASGAKRVTVNLDLERADAKRRFYGKGKLADAHQLREANSVAEKAPVDSDCVRVFRPNNSLFEVAANSLAGLPSSFSAFSLMAAVQRRRIALCGSDPRPNVGPPEAGGDRGLSSPARRPTNREAPLSLAKCLRGKA